MSKTRVTDILLLSIPSSEVVDAFVERGVLVSIDPHTGAKRDMFVDCLCRAVPV